MKPLALHQSLEGEGTDRTCTHRPHVAELVLRKASDCASIKPPKTRGKIRVKGRSFVFRRRKGSLANAVNASQLFQCKPHVVTEIIFGKRCNINQLSGIKYPLLYKNILALALIQF